MNYAGKFDAKLSADGSGLHSSGYVHVETVHATHAPSGAIVVPDAHLLFNGDFKRSGVDLILSRDDQELVLQDYFKGEKRAALSSADGAHLTGDIVNALAGHVEYAQADGSAAAGHVIGHVTKLAGTATAIRNGVSIILNNGDNVEKGDVLQSGSDSTLGITFIDGTVFGLSSNARMVLNEMVYDPNGSNNSSLLSLVAGTITFVAGETAKHGDMKIDTPVATMGIRGTAVLVEIDFDVSRQGGADAKFQVLVEPDGTTGSYILFDKTTLTPLAVVDKAGLQINISNGILSQTMNPLSPEVQKLISDVFSLKFSDNSNTKTLDHFTDSIIPQALAPIKLASGPTATPFVLIVDTPTDSPTTPNNAPNIGHIGGPPNAVILPATAFQITERIGKTGDTADFDTVSGRINFADVNAGDKPTVSSKFDSYTYRDAHGNVASLNAQQIADIHAVEVNLSLKPDPGNNNSGTVVWTYNDPTNPLSVPDSAYDFLAAGETLQLTYLLRVDTNFAPADEATTLSITITITGTNDVPVITSAQQNVDFAAAGTDTKGGTLVPDTATSGTLKFTDPDLTDTHTVSVKLASALLSGKGIETLAPDPLKEFETALTAKIATDSTGTGVGTVNWNLADLQVYLADYIPSGETLTLTYAVTVTDSQNATSTQDVVVTIHGNNSPAVVWIKTGSPSGGLWSVGSNWETGNAPTISDDAIIITDQLQGLTPSFPVKVDDAKAVAKSLTMNDFSGYTLAQPRLDVETTGTLTIAGALNLNTDPTLGVSAESILNNFGNISVGGIAELLKNSVLNNSGLMTLHHGGDFKDSSIITNSGTIEVAGGALNVQVDIANAGGVIQIDNGTMLKLNSSTATGTAITSGNLTLGSGSTLDVESSAGAILDGVAVTGTNAVSGPPATPASTIEVGATSTATLLLDDGTTITNVTLTIGSGSTLDIEQGTTGPGATLDGVLVTENTGDSVGMIDVGTTASGAATLLLDDGTTIIGGAAGTLAIGSGSTLDIEKGTTGPGATLDGVTVTGTNAVTGELGTPASLIEVGATSTAILLLDDGTTITDGNLAIGSGSTLDIEKGTTGPGATLDGVDVTGTNVVTGEPGTPASLIEVGATSTATLLLDDGTTITDGNLTIGSGSKLDIESSSGATLDGVDVTGTNAVTGEPGTPASLIEVGATSTAILLLDDGTTIANGNLTIGSGSTLDIENSVTGTGATLDGVNVTNSGTIQVDPAGAETTTVSLVLDGGTTVTGGTLLIHVPGSPAEGIVEIATGGATLDNVTVTNNNILTIDSSATLTLDGGTAINGGTITENGKIDVTGDSSINGITTDNGETTTTVNAILNHGGVTVESGVTLTLDNVTVNGTIFTDLATSSTIQIGSGDTLAFNGATINGGTIDVFGALDSTGISFITGATIVNVNYIDVTGGTLTIDPAPVTNTGTIEVSGDSTLVLSGETITNSVTTADITTKGIIRVDATDSTHFSTLDLEGSTINGGMLNISGVLDSTGDSFITGATITNTGTIDVTSGTLTIDATSTFINTGKLESNGGNLIIDTAFSGNLEIRGDAVLELGAGSPTTYSAAMVTFDPAATGTLKLDHSQVFAGKVVGLDDNTIDLVDISSSNNGTFVPPTVTYSGDSTHGILTIVSNVNSTQVAHIQLTGDYTGVTWAATNDGNGGTSVTEVPGVIAGLDSNGNASEGSPIKASITDGGAGVNATYAWQIFENGGWVPGSGVAGLNGNYTPGETDEGHLLRAFISFVDALGHNETAFVSAGTVNPVAEAGTAAAPEALTLKENDSNVAITGVSVGPLTEDGADTVSAALTIGHGALHVGSLTGVQVTGDDSGTLTVSGDAAAVNTLLQGLTYTPTGEYEGSDQLKLSVTSTDGFSTSATPATASTTIMVNPVAEAAAAAAPSTLTLNENDTGVAITGVSIGPPAEDSDDSVSAALTVGHGALHVGSLTGVQVTGDDSGTLTVSGDAAAVNTLLQGLTYTPTGAYEGSDTLNLSVTSADGLNIYPTPATTSTTITVNPVATGPTEPFIWTAPDNGSWSVGGNWNNGVAPGQSDQAQINSNVTVTIDQDSVAVASLLLDGGATLAGNTLALGSGNTLDVEVGLNGFGGNSDLSSPDVNYPDATLDGVTITAADITTMIEVGISTTGAILTLDDGATIVGGTLKINNNAILDVEVGPGGQGGASGNGDAVLDGVSVQAADNTSTIEVGFTTTGATLTLEDGTTIAGGTLKINSGSILDVEVGQNGFGGVNGEGPDVIHPDATLDGVIVQALDNTSTIEVGSSTSGAILTLDDGTNISNATLTVGSGSTLDIEAGSNGLGATLDGTSVNNSGTVRVDSPILPTTTLTLDDGTTIAGGALSIGSQGVLDIEVGSNGQGNNGADATLDGVQVTNSGSIFVEPTTSGAILTLDDGTTILGGKLTVGNDGSGVLDIEIGNSPGGPANFWGFPDSNFPDATLDGVKVINNGTIDVGLSASGAIVALDDGTTISGGEMNIGGNDILEVVSGSNGAGATLDNVYVSNSGAIQVGVVTEGDPTLTLKNGTTIIDGTLSIGHLDTLDIERGANDPGATLDSVFVNSADSTSMVTLGNGSTLTLTGTTIHGGTVNFVGTGDTLALDTGSRITGKVSGVSNGDTIDFTDVSSNENPSFTYNNETGVLQLDYVATVNGEFIARHEDITLTGSYTQSDFTLSDDGNGGTKVTENLPTINGGPQTASVADGGLWYATGKFTASDPGNDTLTWSIDGGSRYASASYQYGIHEFKVVNGTSTTVFDDTFNGTVPPAGPAILVGSSPSGSSYNDFGSGTYVQGNGEALINGSNAGFVGTAFGANTYGDPVFGQFTTLLTGTSFNAPAGDGLRSGQSFSASGLFDLITPADNNTRYGIRLSDRASLAGANNQPGTETVDLGVIRNGNGTASVLLSELNFETGISTALQVATLNVQPGDNQILLSLSNDAANNGQIHASYTLEKSDGHGGEIADGGRVTLAAVGHIFDNEDWTRPQFYGTSTATTTSSSPQADSVMQGTYGQLDLAQDGAWHYVLNPGLPSVKALAAGQTAQDNFQVTVTNAAGAHSSQTISVTVTGVNDAPVATAPAQYSVFPGAPLSLVNTGLSVSDVDGGSSIETATLSAGEGIITIAAGNSGVSNISGNGTGSVTFSGTIAQINALLNTSSGTVVYADNTVSPSGSTTLTLTIDDNGSNGGSALSGTASSTINLPFGNSDWRHAIDPFAATQGTSTQWIVPNSDGFTSTVFNGGGFTYDPVSHLPTGGGIASINLVSNFGQGILETITGVAVSLGDFGSFIARVESIQSKIPWSSLVEGNNGPTSFSSTDVRFANSDGTFTEIIGNGFVASQNSQPTGTVTSVEQLDAQGNVLHTADFGGGASLGDVASAIFGDNLSQQFYDLAALNHTRLTSFSGAALDDAPGNHTFVGAGQFSSVDFGEATSGVTVNLGTVVSGMLVSGQGTANWGGYHDTLTNILGITGSRFADTITGDNNSNFLDGHGAPSGSHDTLTGGGGSDMFGFQKGYGALTITDFDQGNSGSFSQTENDFIFLNNFASRPTVSYASGNTVLDFGSGDVLTLLNVTQQEFMALGNSEFFGYPGPALDLNAVTSGTGTTLLYLETLPAASIAPQPILNDFSSSDFNGGTLTVALTANGTTDDQLTIFNQGSGPGQIGVSGNTIFFGGVAIGTFSGGASGAPLSIVFNSDVATTFAVQALVGDIQFSTTSSDLQPLPRAITFTVVDGGNNDSSAVATVNVVETAVQFVLTGGNDIFAGNSGHPTLVVGDSSTLNSGDSLVGGGHDALVLENGGNFALNGLSAFSGFSQLILDNFSNNSATVTLGSFVPASVAGGGTGFTYVSNDTVADWNPIAAFSGISQISLNTSWFISPPGSPPAAPVVYDLTHNSFTNVGALSLDGVFGTTTTYLIDSAVASGVSSIFGSFGTVQLSTSDATLDLSHDNLSGVRVVSTNVTGTTFIVGNAAEASDIFGGPGQDTIQASGFAFTSAQKDAIFASSSIETIVDQSGTYQAPSPDPSVIRLTTGSDTVGPSPDGLTVNATSSTLTSGDSLVGGGHDGLVLENGGDFALNGLSAFSGFSQLILDNFSNNSATVTLGSFVPASVVSGGTGFTYVSNDTVADWNSTAAFSGISQISLNTSGFISPPGSPPAAPVVYDLTHNSFTNVGALSLDGAFGTTTTYLIDSAVASGVSSIFGSFGGLVQLSTSDATLDLSYDNLSGVSVVSTNVTGTTFIVGNAAEASDIFGGPGQDTIQASGFAFTSAQKDAVFASSSIETIVDQSGTYQAPPVLHSFKLTVSEGVPTVLTTADFNVTNAQSTDFFSLQPGSVKGGEFEVTSDGANWVSAPTGGPPFSIAEIELGHVRFHPDGTATVPDFSIWVSDGSNASAAIAPNVTLDIATGTNSETISFGGNNGTLLLEDPSHFTGEIAGISGTGEVLDLHGFAAATTTAVTGSGSYHSATNTTTLTVTDLSVSNPPSETFTLAGNLSASSWTVSDDLNGGTNIVDPPATSQSVGPVVAHDPGPAVNSVTMHDPGPASSMIVASAPNQTLSGLAASDTFVFNFAAVGQDKVTNFHPASDTLQFSGTIFANAQAALNAMQDDGHGNTVVAIDAHDTITLSGVLKAQLHVSDFHVV